MKRRDFLMSASAAGILLPSLGRAAGPCPPPNVSVDGGTSAATPCPTSTSPAPAPPPPSSAGSYSTDFALTENPISEGGRWHQTATQWTKVKTMNGIACGTNGQRDTYDDSFAYLAGFPADHEIEGVIARNNPTGENHEVELLLRWGDTSSSIQGYECLLNFQGSIQIFRLNSRFITSSADYEQLGAGRYLVNPQSGDRFRARIVGFDISVYFNNELLATATDTQRRWASGNPGIGFFKRASGLNESFGFTSITARGL